MLNKKFYFKSLRKIVVGFGTLFNNVQIDRKDNDSAAAKSFVVPLSYAPREHYMATLRDGLDGLQTILPRMSYEMTGMQYDATRKLTTTGFTKGEIPTPAIQEFYKQLNPVPYNVSFDLNIFTRTIEDSLQIIEQIVPYFTPGFNIAIKEVDELNIVRDVQILLESVQPSDTWEDSVEGGRVITWTLSFTAEMNLYPPVEVSKVILKAISDIKKSVNVVDENITVEVSPITAKKSEPHTTTTTIL